MMKEENKDLEYYKNNAEEDYMKVPISVLRYITELEQKLSKEEKRQTIWNFDCYKRDRIMKTKTIKALNKENAIIIFESKYKGYDYFDPY